MLHSAADPAEFNAVCRSKSNLPNRTDSNAALLPYLTHQLGSAHEWSGVWNGPKSAVLILGVPFEKSTLKKLKHILSCKSSGPCPNLLARVPEFRSAVPKTNVV